MKGARVVSAGIAILGLATGSAAASQADVDAAMGTLTTLIGVAVLWWVVGNMLTQHRYDSGGPKGGPVQKD